MVGDIANVMENEIRHGFCGIAKCFENDPDKAAEYHIRGGDLEGAINVAYDCVINLNPGKAKDILEKAGFEVGSELFKLLFAGSEAEPIIEILSNNKHYKGIVTMVDRLFDEYKSGRNQDPERLKALPDYIEKIKDKKLRNETLEKYVNFFFDEQDEEMAWEFLFYMDIEYQKRLLSERKNWYMDGENDSPAKNPVKSNPLKSAEEAFRNRDYLEAFFCLKDVNSLKQRDDILFEFGKKVLEDEEESRDMRYFYAVNYFGDMIKDRKRKNDSLFEIGNMYLEAYGHKWFTPEDRSLFSTGCDAFAHMNKDDPRRDDGLSKVGDVLFKEHCLSNAVKYYAMISDNNLRTEALRKAANKALQSHDFSAASEAFNLLRENINTKDLDHTIKKIMKDDILSSHGNGDSAFLTKMRYLTKVCMIANHDEGLKKIMKYYTKWDSFLCSGRFSYKKERSRYRPEIIPDMENICAKTNSSRHWLMLGNHCLNRFNFKKAMESYKKIVQNFGSSIVFNFYAKLSGYAKKEPEHATGDGYNYIYPGISEVSKGHSRAEELRCIGRIGMALEEGKDEEVRKNIKDIKTFPTLYITSKLCKSYGKPFLASAANERVELIWDW